MSSPVLYIDRSLFVEASWQLIYWNQCEPERQEMIENRTWLRGAIKSAPFWDSHITYFVQPSPKMSSGEVSDKHMLGAWSSTTAAGMETQQIAEAVCQQLEFYSLFFSLNVTYIGTLSFGISKETALCCLWFSAFQESGGCWTELPHKSMRRVALTRSSLTTMCICRFTLNMRSMDTYISWFLFPWSTGMSLNTHQC